MAARKAKDKAEGLRGLTFKQMKWTLIGLLALLVLGILIGLRIRKGGSGVESEIMQTLNDIADDAVYSQEGIVTTVTKSSIEKVVHSGKLYTAEYPYNGIAAVYDSNDGTLKYHVAYEGTVKAGIDVSQIEVSLDEDTNTIIIYLPKVQVDDPIVEVSTLEYIFEDSKYNTETVAQEAYKAAIANLKRRVSDDPQIEKRAVEAAKMTEWALVDPWVNQVDGDVKYTVKVIGYGEEQ